MPTSNEIIVVEEEEEEEEEDVLILCSCKLLFNSLFIH